MTRKKFSLINASENRIIFILYNLVDKAYLNMQFLLLILSVLKFLCIKIRNPENLKIQKALVPRLSG
jgi:hypothetical protein